MCGEGGRSTAYVGVRQRRVLGACEHARMASSSSIRPARLTGSLRTIRFGVVAGWWRVRRGDLVKDALISVVVGVLLLFGAWWWDAKLQERQDALETAIANRQDDLAKAIADRQDDLARDLANQAEVLENTRFVRQIATSEGDTPKPFASINLRGAELGGLHLRCTELRRHLGCADFSNADLGEANLAFTDLRGAGLEEADLHKATLDMADLTGASLFEANLDGVTTRKNRSATFRDARWDQATLVQARLRDIDFTGGSFTFGNADEADFYWGHFDHANLRRSSFKHADMRYATFRAANITRVDLTSADLRGANFTRADLRRSRFKHADLRGANFRRANMTRVDLTSADLRRGADFTGADLRRTVLTDVCFDHTTKWGSNSPPATSSC